MNEKRQLNIKVNTIVAVASWPYLSIFHARMNLVSLSLRLFLTESAMARHTKIKHLDELGGEKEDDDDEEEWERKEPYI